MFDLTKDEQKTLNAYNSNTSDWASKHDDSDFWAKETAYFKKCLPGGNIIEIGVGSGRDAELFIIDRNYNYVGTDISDNLLDLAKKRNPTGEFQLASLYQLQNFKGKFDGFWCAAVLLHVPKTRLDEAVSSIASTIKTGGIGFLSTKIGSGEGLEIYSANKNEQRFISYYSKEQLTESLNKAGLEVIWENIVKERINIWQSLIVQKVG